MIDAEVKKYLKDYVFEVFAAGYEAGYASKKDLKTAFEIFWKQFQEMMSQLE